MWEFAISIRYCVAIVLCAANIIENGLVFTRKLHLYYKYIVMTDFCGLLIIFYGLIKIFYRERKILSRL